MVGLGYREIRGFGAKREPWVGGEKPVDVDKGKPRSWKVVRGGRKV